MIQQSSVALPPALILITSFGTIFFILGIIAFIIMIVYVIRLWLTQTATFQMQKDIADIKNYLLNINFKADVSKPLEAIDNSDIETSAVKNKVKIKLPRKLFIFLSATIPLLLIWFYIISNRFH